MCIYVSTWNTNIGDNLAASQVLGSMPSVRYYHMYNGWRDSQIIICSWLQLSLHYCTQPSLSAYLGIGFNCFIISGKTNSAS